MIFNLYSCIKMSDCEITLIEKFYQNGKIKMREIYNNGKLLNRVEFSDYQISRYQTTYVENRYWFDKNGNETEHEIVDAFQCCFTSRNETIFGKIKKWTQKLFQ